MNIWLLISNKGEIIERIESTEGNVSVYMYEKYLELNKRAINSILEMSTEVMPAAPPNDIARIETFFNDSVPPSYIDFQRIVGGFAGKVATTEAEIFPISKILSSDNEFSPLPTDPFWVIGKVGGIYKIVVMRSKDLSAPKFGIMLNSPAGVKGLNLQVYAYTLYELLELICHDRIPEIASYNRIV